MRIPVAGITALSLSLAGGAVMFSPPALSQQQQDEAQAGQQGQTGAQAQQQEQAGQQGQQQDDALIVAVEDVEVRQSDVLEAISALPPQLRQSPPQMLISAVVDQLVLRTLILDQARAENLGQDPQVTELAKAGSAAAEDRALVQVWVQRELEERVTDAAVEETFAELKAADPAMTLTLEEARPQIEQALQRQAMAQVSAELREDADITYYGPTGEPLDIESLGQAQGQNQGQGQAGGQNQQ